MTHIPIEERLLERIELSDTGCWVYTGGLDKDGYGKIKEGPRGGRTLRSHRVAYELWHGEIPPGLELDHLCRTRNCVNPSHMECVSGLENTMRGRSFVVANAAKTHCPKEHPYDKNNTLWTVVRRYENGRVQWGRRCRECLAAKRRAYRREKRLGQKLVKA